MAPFSRRKQSAPAVCTAHRNPIFLLLVLLCIILLSACAGPSVKPDSPAAQLQQQALAAEEAGEYNKAAELYQQLAADSSDVNLRQEWLIKAAQSHFRAGQSQASVEILAKLDVSTLNTQQLLQRQLLVAALALEDRDYSRARTALDFDIPEQTDTLTRQQIHKLRITAFNALNDSISAARSHIELDKLLTDDKARRFNQQALWLLLRNTPLEDLEQARASAFDSDTLGWLQLAIIAQQSAQQATRRISEWRGFFPAHPADEAIIDSILALQNREAYRPSSIALLLPLKGPLQNAGRAIRDGFLTAYYQADHSHTPTVRIYDVTSSDGEVRSDIFTLYQNAVNEGAEFIIGPLSKNAIESLAFRNDLTTPLLALNYLSTTSATHDLFFQFGLSPEDEARQVAERAWNDGHTQAIALTPAGEWGERMHTAFANHWESLGGILVDSKFYDANASDFSRPLRSLLQLNQSQTRQRSLQQQLGLQLHFEPHRRSDADFIFLAAFPRQGRLLKPQLKFHHAGDLPVYASSHIFSGVRDANADRDINGVIFCDTRWAIDPQASGMQQQVLQLWPQNSHDLLRLYALGADAFRLIPHLNSLRQSQYYSYEGQTGVLSMDSERRLRRKLAWAKIKNGVPVPLAEPRAAPSPSLTPFQ